MPEISIIVPNYNHARFLPLRLDSIFNQSYQDYEVILLDDCSTDNSNEILSQYSNHPKVTAVVLNEQNSGSTFKQWGKGIKIATGEFIWIAESDDWCEPTLLETLISAFNKYPGTVMGYVQSYKMTDDNCINWISKQDALEKLVNGNDFIKQYLLTGNAIYNASMAVFRKSAYYQLEPEFENFKFCGDWLFWSGIASQGDVFISGKVLNYFRNHTADVSGKAYASGLNFNEELKVLFSLSDKKLINESEFFYSLNLKHINYRINRSGFSPQMIHETDYFFYSDERTKKYKSQLLRNFRIMLFKKRLINMGKKILR